MSNQEISRNEGGDGGGGLFEGLSNSKNKGDHGVSSWGPRTHDGLSKWFVKIYKRGSSPWWSSFGSPHFYELWKLRWWWYIEFFKV